MRPQESALQPLRAGAAPGGVAFLDAISQWKRGEKELELTEETVKLMGLRVDEQDDVGHLWDHVIPGLVRALAGAPSSDCIRMDCTACHGFWHFPWNFTALLGVPGDFDNSSTFGGRLTAELDAFYRAAALEALRRTDGAFLRAYTEHTCGTGSLKFTVDCVTPEVLMVSTLTGWADTEGVRTPEAGSQIPLELKGVEQTFSSDFLPGTAVEQNEFNYLLSAVVVRQGDNPANGHYITYLRNGDGG